MNVLDSPLEALAFNYLSFGLNNLWAWLALFTAALSFWKIRSTGFSQPHPKSDPLDEVVMPLAETVVKDDTVPSTVTNVVLEEEDFDRLRKGKFTLYYEEDEVQCSCDDDESEGSLILCGEEEKEGEAEWWKRWERLLRLRNGVREDGWYMWQDLTELNGNVVRLWDGGFESWYRSSCVDVW